MPFRSKKKKKNILSRSLTMPAVAACCVIAIILGYVVGLGVGREKPTMVFVQQSVTGSFRPVNAVSGAYVLTLAGVKPHTLLYGDHPQRFVGSWTNDDFIARWNQNDADIARHPPQAVLLSHSAVDGKEYAVTIELRNPAFNAFAGTLTYDATILDDAGKHGLVPSADRHMDAFPEVLRSAALFIDSWGKR